MTTANSPRAASTSPARIRPRGPAPSRPAAYHPVSTLVIRVTTASAAAGSSTGRQRRRVDREPERDEEHGGKDVPQRRQEGARPFCRLAGQRQPDEEGAHRSRGIQQRA